MTQILDGVPSGSGVCYYLGKLSADITSLEQQLNQILQAKFSSQISNHRQHLAIDLPLIPYYDQPNLVETSYRIKKHCHIRSTTKKPILASYSSL
ncbi:MAG: hypothetical protein AAFY20_22915 [Cyanobacteria bacterium J06639_14]